MISYHHGKWGKVGKVAKYKIPMNQFRNHKQKRFDHLDIDDWNLFGICLPAAGRDFEIWNLNQGGAHG
jgi:hypothetical protein